MVAAPALGEIVKQPGEEQDLAPLEVRHQARAQRVLVRVLRLGEPAQVADHHQDVLVDRVHVEQVVLHLPDDAAERRQVVPEDVVEVHAPQLVDDAAGRAEELDEARAGSPGRGGTPRRCDGGCATARAAYAPTCRSARGGAACAGTHRASPRAAARTGARRGRAGARRSATNSSSIGIGRAAIGNSRACRFCSRIVLTCRTAVRRGSSAASAARRRAWPPCPRTPAPARGSSAGRRSADPRAGRREGGAARAARRRSARRRRRRAPRSS